jgi:predicted HicB family RNase H-like nuclease
MTTQTAQPDATKALTLRLDPALHDRCVQAAEADNRPLSGWIRDRLAKATAKELRSTPRRG